MSNKIFGTVIDSNSGQPLKGLRIQAWDEDWPDGSDFMGTAYTNDAGKYTIAYHDGYWDNTIPGLSSWRPDIYLTVEIKNISGRWVHLGKSQVHKDHNLDHDLQIDIEVNIEDPIKMMTGFIPTSHGFHFINNFKISAQIFNLMVQEKGMGFCGGMCAGALYRFNHGLEVPLDHISPASGMPLYDELLKRQIKTMHPVVLTRMYSFQSAPDQVDQFRKRSIGQLTKDEWPNLKAALDSGKPTILVLIRAKGFFGNPTINHQVLAIGYNYNPVTRDLKIYAYDPNKPDLIQSLSMNLGLPDGKLYLKDTARVGTRGFFVSPYGETASE